MVAQLCTMEENLSPTWYICCEKNLVLPTRVLDLVGTISGHFLLPWLSGFERLTLQLVPKLEATLQAIFQDKAGWSSALATEFQPAVMCFYQVVDTYLVLVQNPYQLRQWGERRWQNIWMRKLSSWPSCLKSTSVDWVNWINAYLARHCRFSAFQQFKLFCNSNIGPYGWFL